MPLPLEQFLKIRNDHVVIDVRSEGEFVAGHIPNAINIPILNDAERVIVGTAYKKHGQRHAIKEGFRLVGPRLNELVERTENIAEGREVLVHCWRGGMRSRNFCQFVAMAGVRSQSLDGGYKAYRTRALASFRLPLSIMLLSGYTGGGKSEILRRLKDHGEQVIDLEMLAIHKGSAFGGLFLPPQPTTEQFQNDLFEAIMALDPTKRIWIEDESLAIGKIFLPVDFWNGMKHSPMVEIEVDKNIRVHRLVDEYGAADKDVFLEIMKKLVKRLGGQHFNAAKDALLKGDMHTTIDILLTYYDKAYRESINKRSNDRKGVIAWDGKNVSGAVKLIIDLMNSTEWKK